RLRTIAPDAVLTLEFFSRYAALMSVLSGAPVRVGFHAVSAADVGSVWTHRVHLIQQKHISENLLVFSEALKSPVGQDGIIKSRMPRLPTDTRGLIELSDDMVRESKAVLLRHGVQGSYIVLSPTCSPFSRDLKLWPDAHWNKLAAILKEQTGMRLLATGRKQERGMVERALAPHALNLAGELSFEAMVSVLAGARLVVSLDSGPAHLASFLKVPTIDILGPVTPVLYGIEGSASVNMHEGLSCSPCYNLLEGKYSDCHDNLCLKSLMPESVAAAARALLVPVAPGK
ncbi:MAG: glycosyltransferase family 9 protein, partial [Elusimicrobiota bacterium]